MHGFNFLSYFLITHGAGNARKYHQQTRQRQALRANRPGIRPAQHAPDKRFQAEKPQDNLLHRSISRFTHRYTSPSLRHLSHIAP
jgi:hypothetical protein